MSETPDMFSNFGGSLVAAVAAPSVGRGSENVCAALDKPKAFDGETFSPNQDGTRLKAQLVRVRELMRDGKWRSLSEISKVTGDPEASTSARLRDLRKPKFGLWTVNRRRRTKSLFEYQLGGKGL